MLIITQEPWSTTDLAASLGPTLRAARAEADSTAFREFSGTLLLLPQAETGDDSPPTASALLAHVGGLAKASGLHLAGSAIVADPEHGANRCMGFLVSDTGEALLNVNKISPDFVNGFTDTICDLGLPAAFPVAETPIGKVGLLPGEDILFAHYARSLAWNGAELLLNPCVERGDAGLETRQRSRYGRATDNNCFVAAASPRFRTMDGVRLTLPVATAFFHSKEGLTRLEGEQSFLFPDYDLQEIRRRRVNPGVSFGAFLRADVYASTYAGRQPLAEKDIPKDRAGWLGEAKRRVIDRHARVGPIMEGAHEQYGALLIQQVPRLVKFDGKVDAGVVMQKNLDTALELAETRAKVPTMRLVVMPEFWLTGPGGIGGIQRTVENMKSMAISYPGPIFERISAFAQANGVYVAFQNFEVHEKFPNHVFNAAFLIDDSGNLIHTYRKIQDADVWGLFPTTTPGSVLDRYLDVFGAEGLFPVARTPLGNLANMICFDTMHPEIARGLAKAGAEVILHSSSEVHGANLRQAWDNARRLRASENTAIMLSAIDGGEYEVFDSDQMTFFRRGHTRAVNYDGNLMGTCDGPGPVAWRVELDLAALRRARANPSTNLLLWDDDSVYAEHYRGDVGMPGNLWTGDPLVNPYIGAKQIAKRIANFVERGIFIPPSHRSIDSVKSIPDTM
jgi:predicted amidohydrolase